MPAPRKFAEETRARGARLPGPGCAITASPSWLRAGTWGNCWASTPRCCELDRGREAGYASGRPGHDEFGRRYGQTAAVGSRSLRVAAGAVRPSGTGCRE